MKAIICKEFSSPSHIYYEEVESPTPQKGEVKIKVHACGVNFLDTLIVQGLYQVKPALPFSPGSEVAGEIIKLGEGVTDFQVGDRVMGILDYGGYAEEAILPVRSVIPIPENMPYEHAAGFPIVYGTSHIALQYRANLQKNETLLVLGASGGVGLTAVELGKLMGATVIAAASTDEKLELTRQYGADHTINYTTEDLRQRVKEITNGKGVDVVYDPVGGDLFTTALRSIAWGGRLLVIGFASGQIPEVAVNRTLLKNCSIMGVYWGAYAINEPQTMQMSFMQLMNWYMEGKLNPHISQIYPLADANDALQAIIHRTAIGKLILQP